jgi:chromosome segregation protein
MHIKLYTDKCGEYRDNISEIEKKIGESNNRIEENKSLYKDYDDQLNKLIKVEKSMSQDQLKLNDERDKLKERIIKLEGELDKMDAKKNSLNDLIVNTGIQIQNVNTELAEVINEIQMYDFEEEDFGGEKKSLEDLKRAIPEIERRLESLQPVNLRAIDEYNRQNERLETLNRDVEQLEVQKENLNEIVNELKTKKKDGLMVVFNAVNDNFKDIFNQVSIGGTAELILENPKDPFEAGLIIRARPRNKKFMRLEALSGGEKSLTALALIFAIQRYQPSPFYVLDEVDMFLDSINAENIGKMITKNAELAQFIVVSLRKVTFKDANHVYGVTMQGTGISYLIGKVNLAEVGEDGEIMKDIEDVGGGPPEDIPEVTGG